MTQLVYAGQFNIIAIDLLKADGVAVDIRSQVDQVTVYEDIFSPFMSGNLVMIDTVDLASDMYTAGVDMLRLQIETPGMPKETNINRYFHIYKLSDRVVMNERTQSYVLHFTSSDSLVDSSVNISKTYRAKAEANIQSILSEQLNSAVPYDADPTVSNITYTSNYWTPTQNITYNTDHAVCAKDNTPSMMFFENRNGFQFKSLVGLSNAASAISLNANDLTTKITTKGSQIGDTVPDFTQDYGTILTVNAPIYFDYMKDKANGTISSRMYSFDFTTKRISDITFDVTTDGRARANPITFYGDTIVKSSHRGSHSTIGLINNRHLKMYNGTVDVTDFAIKQRRIALIRSFQQHKIEVTVLGRTDYTVGKTVDVEINRMRGFTKEQSMLEINDPMLSGKYVISAICHRFGSSGKHESTFELIRDSLGKKK